MFWRLFRLSALAFLPQPVFGNGFASFLRSQSPPCKNKAFAAKGYRFHPGRNSFFIQIIGDRKRVRQSADTLEIGVERDFL